MTLYLQAFKKWVRRCQLHQRFYVWIFRINIVLAAFSSYVFALVKNLYKKHMRKMLMKLTAGGRVKNYLNRTRWIGPRQLYYIYNSVENNWAVDSEWELWGKMCNCSSPQRKSLRHFLTFFILFILLQRKKIKLFAQIYCLNFW